MGKITTHSLVELAVLELDDGGVTIEEILECVRSELPSATFSGVSAAVYRFIADGTFVRCEDRERPVGRTGRSRIRVKYRPWTTEELIEMGEIEPEGVDFLSPCCGLPDGRIVPS